MAKSTPSRKSADHQPLRDHLIELLRGGSAHLDFDKAVAGLPANLRGAKPAGQPHTHWRLVEHMRIAQWDILEFCRNPKHKSPKWPQGYWPAGDAPPTRDAWTQTIGAFRADRDALIKIVKDRKNDLLSPIPHGDGQTIAREVMLAADHTSYHVGQLVM